MTALVPTSLATPRLRLRLPRNSDAATVCELSGDIRVSGTTAAIPHPYTLDHAFQWFGRIADRYENGTGAAFVIERLEQPGVIGAIGLLMEEDRVTASAGYWLGHPFWRHGYATEALRELLRYGFQDLGLLRIHACHMVENPASGRVMAKAGMRFDNIIAQGCRRGERLYDKVTYSLFADEWQQPCQPS